MRLVTEAGSVRLLYETPRGGLDQLGIRPGTPLFSGRKTGATTYTGDVSTFSPRQCGETKFPVSGESTPDGRRIVLRGQLPVRDAQCRTTGYRAENLIFEMR